MSGRSFAEELDAVEVLDVTPFITRLQRDYPVTLRLHARGERLVLDKIVVDRAERGTGVGSSVMATLAAFADEHGIVVSLTPEPLDGLARKEPTKAQVRRLVDFYKRFGFVENKGRALDFEISERMYRLPA